MRSPAKSALLALAAGQVGMGRGLGVHKALDQIGAFAGPLLVAAVIAASAGALWPALAVLALPGAVAMVLLVRTRHRMPGPDHHLPTTPILPGPAPQRPGGAGAEPGRSRPRLPPAFRWLAAGTALCTAGLVTYGLISFHLVARGVVAIAAVPLLYAAAMAAGAAAALVTGLAYDRFGARVLLALPMLGAAAAPLAFSDTVAPAVAGVLLWGAAVGVQDSTVKALVADLVTPARRATGYGIFAGVQGAGALLGGVAAGALYEQSRPTLINAVVATQLVAMLLLAPVTAGARRGRTSRA